MDLSDPGIEPVSPSTPALQESKETQVRCLDGEDPLEKEMANLQYSCLGKLMDRGAGRLQFMRSQRVKHDLATKQ